MFNVLPLFAQFFRNKEMKRLGQLIEQRRNADEQASRRVQWPTRLIPIRQGQVLPDREHLDGERDGRVVQPSTAEK